MSDPRVTKPWLERVLKAEVVSFTATLAVGKGENFICKVYRIQAEIIYDGKRQTQKFVAKLPSTIDIQDNIITQFGVYEREVFFYKRLIPGMKYFQEQRSQNPPDLAFPELIGGSDDPADSYLLLKDLQPAGYRMVDKRNYLDWDHCGLVLTALADYHSVTIAMRETGHTELIEECMNLIEDKNKIVLQTFPEKMTSILTLISELLEKIPEFSEHLPAFQRLTKDSKRVFSQSMSPVELWGVIVHGDCWSSNMMFRYERRTEGPEKVSSVRLFDLQTITYTSVAVDLNHFLYSTASTELLKTRQADLLQFYHSRLDARLRDLGLDQYQLQKYSFQSLMEDINIFRGYGYVIGMIMTRMFLLDNEVLGNIDVTDDDSLASAFKVQNHDKSMPANLKFRMQYLLEEIMQVYPPV